MKDPDAIFEAAERALYRQGFSRTGMDDLAASARVSSRTLYKHTGSRAELIASVLARRHARFFAPKVETVGGLFDALEAWTVAEEARGCLFLRAYAETGSDARAVQDRLAEHKEALRKRIEELVDAAIGPAPELALQIQVLFEGATWTAMYRGIDAVRAAKAAALALLNAKGGR